MRDADIYCSRKHFYRLKVTLKNSENLDHQNIFEESTEMSSSSTRTLQQEVTATSSYIWMILCPPNKEYERLLVNKMLFEGPCWPRMDNNFSQARLWAHWNFSNTEYLIGVKYTSAPFLPQFPFWTFKMVDIWVKHWACFSWNKVTVALEKLNHIKSQLPQPAFL